METSKLCI